MIINGTPENDILLGTPDADVIFGLEGNDQLSGDGGDDVLLGGPGGDTFSAGFFGTAVFVGEEGADRFNFFTGSGATQPNETVIILDFQPGEDAIQIVEGNPRNLDTNGDNILSAPDIGVRETQMFGLQGLELIFGVENSLIVLNVDSLRIGTDIFQIAG